MGVSRIGASSPVTLGRVTKLVLRELLLRKAYSGERNVEIVALTLQINIRLVQRLRLPLGFLEVGPHCGIRGALLSLDVVFLAHRLIRHRHGRAPPLLSVRPLAPQVVRNSRRIVLAVGRSRVIHSKRNPN